MSVSAVVSLQIGVKASRIGFRAINRRSTDEHWSRYEYSLVAIRRSEVVSRVAMSSLLSSTFGVALYSYAQKHLQVGFQGFGFVTGRIENCRGDYCGFLSTMAKDTGFTALRGCLLKFIPRI